VKLNEATIRMLRVIEPYVTYEYTILSTITKLIYKLGFCKIKKQRIPISENKMIEELLGRYNVCCAADLIHELYTVGKRFKECNTSLWTFKLSSPLGGFSRKAKLLHFMEGGEAGASGEKINKLVKRIL